MMAKDRRAYLTEAKRRERARHREAGRVAVTVYVHPEDKAAVRELAESLNERRETKVERKG